MSVARKGFDLDLSDNEAIEELLDAILRGKHLLEVKCDYCVGGTLGKPPTGNVAIERRYKGEHSGLNATEAHWWLQALAGDQYQDGEGLPEVVVMIRASRLRELVQSLEEQGKVWGTKAGDNGDAEVVLVKPAQLLLPRPFPHPDQTGFDQMW